MELVKTKITLAYAQLDGIFTKKEAWALYKFAAYAETVTWVMLLFGIFSKVNQWPLYEWSLAIGGYAHGLVFIFYVFIVFFTHRSMKWSVWHMLWAEALCNVPFGALAFEQYIVRKFKR